MTNKARAEKHRQAFAIEMILADNLKRIRMERGLTQAAVVAGAGVAQRVYSDWEAGKRIPQKEGWDKLCAFLKISPAELLK